jgi:hypothetical protein
MIPIQQKAHPKKASISVKHKDTEIAIQSDNNIGDLMFFIIIAGTVIFGMWLKWGRHKDEYRPKHTTKDNK